MTEKKKVYVESVEIKDMKECSGVHIWSSSPLTVIANRKKWNLDKARTSQRYGVHIYLREEEK